MGNHTWDNKDIFEFIDDAKKMVRPANFPEDAWSRNGFCESQSIGTSGDNLLVRTFMVPLEDPFKSRRVSAIARKRTPPFCGFSWRTTSEKQAMSWF